MPHTEPNDNKLSPPNTPKKKPDHKSRLIRAINWYGDLDYIAFPLFIKITEKEGAIKKDTTFSFKWREESISREESLRRVSANNWNVLALLTGKKYNLFVLDIDVKDAQNGFKTLREQNIVIPPTTPAVKTPSGGKHYYFAFPENLEGKSTRAFKELGFDIRGDGGIIFAPPSLLKVTQEYEWEILLKSELSPPPESLISFINSIDEEKSADIASINDSDQTLSDVTRKQRDVFFDLLSNLKNAQTGERSEADFAVIAWGIKIGLSRDEIFNQVKSFGKFAEKDNQGLLENYFDTSYTNAFNTVQNDQSWQPPFTTVKKNSKWHKAQGIKENYNKCLAIIDQAKEAEDTDLLFDNVPLLAELPLLEWGKIKTRVKRDFDGITTDLDKAVNEQRKVTQNSPKDITLREEKNIIEILDSSEDTVKLYPAQDFKDDKMWYSAQTKNGIIIFNSQKEHFPLADIQANNQYQILSEPDVLKLKPQTVKAFFEDQLSIEEAYKQEHFLALDLFRSVQQHLKRFIFFKNPHHSNLLPLWLMGTYVYTIFQYYPYLHIKAEKRSGKSRLMEIMSPLAFNGEMVTNITEASLFRDIQCNRTTLFLDEVERMGSKDKDSYGALMSILNTGFHCGGKVKRTERFGDAFKVKSYSSYSPKVFAGINELDDVLKDRTILIQLWRKKTTDAVERYRLTKELKTEINHIQQTAFLFGLKYGEHIADFLNRSDIYSQLPEKLSDRERDIYEALFIIAHVIEFEANQAGHSINLLESLKAFSQETAIDRKDDDSEKNTTSKVVHIISEIIKDLKPVGETERGYYYCRDDIFQNYMFRFKSDYFPDCDTSRKLVRLINSTLNIKPLQYLHRPNKKEYLIETGFIEDLRERFL